MAINTDNVEKLYVAYFGRPSDPDGQAYWEAQLPADTLATPEQLITLANSFSLSAEYQAQTAGQSSAQVVNDLYLNLFGRAADAPGLTYWSNELSATTQTVATLAVALILGASADDAAAVTARAAAASAFTAAVDTTPEILAYNGAAAFASANAWLAPVVDAASGTAAIAGVDAAVAAATSGAITGSTFTLTAGVDLADTAGSFRNGTLLTPGVATDFKFTSANEAVVASQTTLNAGGLFDTLHDASTTDNDVLNLAYGGAGVPITTTDIQNIETINVAASYTADSTLSLAGVTGLKTINISGTPGGVLTVDGGAVGTIGDTGVTTIDASGLKSISGGVVIDSSASIATASLTIKGGDGGDTLTGGGAADTISGGQGDDAIAGGNGNDTLSGDNGNDTINGDNGNDTINGGAGNDIIAGGAGIDTINGDDGNDTIASDAGADTVNGGAGFDLITNAGGGKDVITGGADDDTIVLSNAVTDSETLIFGADRAANGSDGISFFKAGAVNAVVGGDVLDFSAFLGAAANVSNGGVVTDVTDGTADVFAGDNVVYINQPYLTPGQDPIAFSANSHIVLIDDNGANLGISYVTTGAAGVVTNIELVGVLTGVTGVTFDAAQFV